YVHLDPSNGSGQCNYHTHGVFESFGHLDFQIVLPIDPYVARGLFHTIIDEVKSGRSFEEGEEYFGLVQDPNIPKMSFMVTEEADRKVMRILIPDQKGIMPGKEECDSAFDMM